MALVGGTLKVIKLGGGTLRDGINALVKETPESCFSPPPGGDNSISRPVTSEAGAHQALCRGLELSL